MYGAQNIKVVVSKHDAHFYLQACCERRVVTKKYTILERKGNRP